MKSIKWILYLLLMVIMSMNGYAVELETKMDYETKAFGLFVEDNAIAEVLRKAQKGDARAQYYQGVIDSRGSLTFFNADEILYSMPFTKMGVFWFKKAAKQGYIEAFVALAKAYGNDEGVPASKEKERAWYKKAFIEYQKRGQQNDKVAQYIVATLYAKGLGVDKNQKQALLWLKKSAAQFYPEAALAMARFHAGHFAGIISYDSEIEGQQNYSLGMRFYSHAGQEYQEEAEEVKHEVQKSMEEAQALFRQKQFDKASTALTPAILSHYIPAYYLNGIILQKKSETKNPKRPEDNNLIITYFELAAKGGMPQAQFELAKLYLQKGDERQSSKWFYKVGEAGLRARNKQAVVGAVQGLNAVAQNLRSDKAAAMSKELQQRARRL